MKPQPAASIEPRWVLEESPADDSAPMVVVDEEAGELAELAFPVVLAMEMARRETGEVLGGLAGLVQAGRPVYCIDAWNRFNPYAFAEWCRTRRIDSRLMLERVFVSRCFTIHQLDAVVAGMVPPLARDPARPIVAVLGLEHLFLEESLSESERRTVLGRVLRGMARARGLGLSLLVAFEGWNDRGAPWWRAPLLAMADRHIRLDRVRESKAPALAMGGRGSPLEGPRKTASRRTPPPPRIAAPTAVQTDLFST